MSRSIPRAQWHPRPDVSLRDWYGDSYDHYAVLLQPFHPDPSRRFPSQDRKDSEAYRWSEAARRLGWSVETLARALHDHLGDLAGQTPSDQGAIEVLRNTGWALAPEDEIGSGVERVIGGALRSLGIPVVEASDAPGTAFLELSTTAMAGPASEFQRAEPSLGAVGRLVVPCGLLVAAWDHPHVLVCARGPALLDALDAAGAELVRLSADTDPHVWWTRL